MTTDPTETDEQRADREETGREHAAGIHTHCGVTCEAEFPSDMLRNGILARAIPGSKGMLDELLRRARAEATVSPAPADTIGLCGYCGVPRESHHHGYVSTAAALAAAPLRITATDEPGALRRAVLHEAAYRIDADSSISAAVHASAALRRMADEAQQTEPVIPATELLTLVTVLEIPRPGNALPLHILRTHPEKDRWAISDRTGRRWFHGDGWMYEAQHIPELERTEARFTLAEALPLAHQLAEEPQP